MRRNLSWASKYRGRDPNWPRRAVHSIASYFEPLVGRGQPSLPYTEFDRDIHDGLDYLRARSVKISKWKWDGLALFIIPAGTLFNQSDLIAVNPNLPPAFVPAAYHLGLICLSFGHRSPFMKFGREHLDMKWRQSEGYFRNELTQVAQDLHVLNGQRAIQDRIRDAALFSGEYDVQFRTLGGEYKDTYTGQKRYDAMREIMLGITDPNLCSVPSDQWADLLDPPNMNPARSTRDRFREYMANTELLLAVLWDSVRH